MADSTITADQAEATATLSAKDEVRALLDRLPDTVTLEDIHYHLGVVVKILRSEERAEREGCIPHDEVVREMESWFAK